MKAVGRENTIMRQRMIDRYERRRQRLFLRIAPSWQPSPSWAADWNEWVYGFREFMKVRSSGSWKDCGMDNSPPRKCQAQVSDRTRLEIETGRRQVLVNAIKERKGGPFSASQAEQNAYIEWALAGLAGKHNG